MREGEYIETHARVGIAACFEGGDMRRPEAEEGSYP